MAALGALHLTKNTGAKHTATVIFFHGSGMLKTYVLEQLIIPILNNQKI